MATNIRILHLEDSIRDSELIRSLIESGKIGYEYFLADNEKDFINILEHENISIILSDYSLPDYNGNMALKIAREKYSHIPFIFVSGAMGEDAAINAMLNGATDYVLKNKLERLVPAINRAMYEHELEKKRHQAEINLKEKSELIEAQNVKYIQMNKELEKAKEKAEENDRIKSIFLTNLSHELRIPLNEILGFSQMITGTNDKQQIMDYAKFINKGGNQLLNIIEDLFIISSILSETIIINIRNIQLSDLLDKARFIINDEMLKSNKEGLTFSIFDNLSSENITVMADYDMFGEVVRKLIRNAIMFSNNGKIEVGYRIEKNNNKPEENNENIIFYVSDTGIGIPVAKLDIIFDFFRRVEESSTRKFGGIGSGLAICKSFVEKMNGNIWVESQLGKGSAFYLKLPLVVKQPENHTIPVKNYKEASKIDLTNKTILIVDNIESNRLYLSYVLKDLGSKILSAENGTIALEILKNARPIDLILINLNIPVKDDYDSISLIKKICPDVPVIVQTTCSLPKHLEKAFGSGCIVLIKKPVEIGELIIKMNECFNKVTQMIYE